jgi:predicted nucleic acid-binding protein
MDPGSRSGPFGEVRRLARTHRLSVYDASYLELAARTALPLATLDLPLREAADAAGLAIFRPD